MTHTGYSPAYPKYKQTRAEAGKDDGMRRLTKAQKRKYDRNFDKIDWSAK